jgi:hypothetical protein
LSDLPGKSNRRVSVDETLFLTLSSPLLLFAACDSSGQPCEFGYVCHQPHGSLNLDYTIGFEAHGLLVSCDAELAHKSQQVQRQADRLDLVS